MSFIESYKHLEKICGEILNDDRRISAYIDEMIKASRGPSLVPGWNDDLKQLKHYRWVRNQIAHVPDCTESNMCEPSDTEWLDNFYSRIMNQTDPLALYEQATKPCRTQKVKQTGETYFNKYTYTQTQMQLQPQTDYRNSTPTRNSGCLLSIVAALAMMTLIVLIGIVLR